MKTLVLVFPSLRNVSANVAICSYSGVTVNSLSPGFVATDVFRKIPPGWRQFVINVLIRFLAKV